MLREGGEGICGIEEDVRVEGWTVMEGWTEKRSGLGYLGEDRDGDVNKRVSGYSGWMERGAEK